jgi:hypothetical protein
MILGLTMILGAIAVIWLMFRGTQMMNFLLLAL